MPIQPTNLTSATERDAAGLGLDLSIAAVKVAMGGALMAARPDASMAALGNALPETDAAGPAVASPQSVLNLLKRYWRAFQERRRRQRLRTSLHHLSERELMDIGIAPGEIEYIVARQAIEKLRDGTAHLWMSRGVM
jgi:uncharacterized protein YjiS (DUF1127 family)